MTNWKWFFRTYWIVPTILGISFNTVVHPPEVLSIYLWTAVTGMSLILALIFGEWQKTTIVERKPE